MPLTSLFFTAARCARARPLLCSASQRSGGDGVGAGGEDGGGAAGHAALELARKSCAELQKLAPPHHLSWESRAQLREVAGATPSLAAFTRPLKFAATVRARTDSRSAPSLEMSASARSRAWARGPTAGDRRRTLRRSRKQVYSYSNKRTNCTRRGERTSNRLARGPGAALHKAIFCVGASGTFACCGVISGFEKRTVARPHFPLWFRRRRKCFAGG